MQTILDKHAVSPASLSNRIGDGRHSATYAELPELLDILDAQLAASAGEDSCLAVVCPNTVAGGALLLALFRRGRSFILAPPEANPSDLKPVPNFCSHRVAVLPDAAVRGNCLQVEANPNFNGRDYEPSRIYLRTSGSMGASKIVVHTHQGLIGNAGNCVVKYGFSPESRVFVPVPVAHMYGFGAEFLPAVLAGSSIELQEKTNVLSYLDREREFKPTIAFVTPTICSMLLKGYRSPRTHYQVMVTSGQRIGEDVFQALDPLIGGRLVNQYGSSEMGATAACDPTDSLEQRLTSIGKPMGGVELRVDEADGNLYCKHPYGYLGYMNEDGDWLKEAKDEPWYRTGDLAAVRPDGSLTVLGRADASVNRSGYLVLLADVERIMEKIATVAEAAVVAGKGESKHGARIGAFCVLRNRGTIDGVSLRKQCLDLMPHYAVPDEVRILESLPLLPGGKIDRRSLAALLDGRP